MDNRKALAVDVLGDAYQLPFKSQSFDWVIADQFFEHCRNPYLVLMEIHRVLKYDGRLDATVPIAGSVSSFDPTHVFIVDRKRWLSIMAGFFFKIEWNCYGIRFEDAPPEYVEQQKEWVALGYSDFAEGLHFVCGLKQPNVRWRAVPWWLEEELSSYGPLTFYELPEKEEVEADASEGISTTLERRTS